MEKSSLYFSINFDEKINAMPYLVETIRVDFSPPPEDRAGRCKMINSEERLHWNINRKDTIQCYLFYSLIHVLWRAEAELIWKFLNAAKIFVCENKKHFSTVTDLSRIYRYKQETQGTVPRKKEGTRRKKNWKIYMKNDNIRKNREKDMILTFPTEIKIIEFITVLKGTFPSKL